jgi:hypothetical protein
MANYPLTDNIWARMKINESSLPLVAGVAYANKYVVLGSDLGLAGLGITTAAYTATAAALGTTRVITGAATTFTTATSGNLVGVRGSVTAGGAVSGSSLYGIQGKIITGANTVAGTIAAVYAQFDMTGGTIGAGNQAAIQANFVGVAAGLSNLNGLYVEQAGGGSINAYCRFLGIATYVFDVESSFTNQSTTGTAGATAAKGWLKILVTNGGGAVVRYIPLTDSVT